MTLLVVLAFVGGSAFGLAAPPFVRWASRPRMPIQMFEGRLFPHPMDDGWHQSGGYGDGYSHGKIRVYRGYIMIDGVTVRDSDERAVRYYEAIDAACKRRAIDKALEALP